MVRQALDRRSLRGRFVDGGEVRDCLSHAGWSQNHIDFLLYRSQHETLSLTQEPIIDGRGNGWILLEDDCQAPEFIELYSPTKYEDEYVTMKPTSPSRD